MSKIEHQRVVVNEAAKYPADSQKIIYLKSVVEFQHLKDDAIILEKLRRWALKLQSEHTSEFRGCIYGAKIDNLVARDIERLLQNLNPKNKKFNSSIVNIDVLDNILRSHCITHGKESVYRDTKRGKGWAVNFCKRHSFNKFIMSVVGSTKSKAKRSFYEESSDFDRSFVEGKKNDFTTSGVDTQSTAKRRRSIQDFACILLELKFIR
jgi:hypothetical protein